MTQRPFSLAGMVGLEPTDEGVKVPCLTAWLHPNIHPLTPPQPLGWEGYWDCFYVSALTGDGA